MHKPNTNTGQQAAARSRALLLKGQAELKAYPGRKARREAATQPRVMTRRATNIKLIGSTLFYGIVFSLFGVFVSGFAMGHVSGVTSLLIVAVSFLLGFVLSWAWMKHEVISEPSGDASSENLPEFRTDNSYNLRTFKSED